MTDENRKNVLITGAGQGYGAALLEIFLAKGWTVFPLIRKESDAEAITAKFKSSCHPIIADIGNDNAVDKITAVLKAHTDRLDLLINNAGIIVKNRGLEETSTQEINDHLNINCLGTVRCVKTVLPFLKNADKAKIINISSRWGSISLTADGFGSAWGGPLYAYKISKAALNMLTVSLDSELKTHNIRVHVIQPGRLKTRVAPPDADLDPQDGAKMFYDWYENLTDDSPVEFYDIPNKENIDW